MQKFVFCFPKALFHLFEYLQKTKSSLFLCQTVLSLQIRYPHGYFQYLVLILRFQFLLSVFSSHDKSLLFQLVSLKEILAFRVQLKYRLNDQDQLLFFLVQIKILIFSSYIQQRLQPLRRYHDVQEVLLPQKLRHYPAR